LQEETYRWPSDSRFLLGFVIPLLPSSEKSSKADGGGDRLDVFHSLHCLVGVSLFRTEVTVANDIDRIEFGKLYITTTIIVSGKWRDTLRDKIILVSSTRLVQIQFYKRLILISLDHCIDHLRQALMCHADLTPMTWEERGNKLILKTTPVHTCRDFQKLQEFVVNAMENIDSKEKEELVTGDLYIID
jgi:hypothetical protein